MAAEREREAAQAEEGLFDGRIDPAAPQLPLRTNAAAPYCTGWYFGMPRVLHASTMYLALPVATSGLTASLVATPAPLAGSEVANGALDCMTFRMVVWTGESTTPSGLHAGRHPDVSAAEELRWSDLKVPPELWRAAVGGPTSDCIDAVDR